MPQVSEDFLEEVEYLRDTVDDLRVTIRVAIGDLRQIAETMHTYDLESNIDSILDVVRYLEKKVGRGL